MTTFVPTCARLYDTNVEPKCPRGMVPRGIVDTLANTSTPSIASITTDTFSRIWSSIVLLHMKWKTICSLKVCFVQVTYKILTSSAMNTFWSYFDFEWSAESLPCTLSQLQWGPQRDNSASARTRCTIAQLWSSWLLTTEENNCSPWRWDHSSWIRLCLWWCFRILEDRSLSMIYSSTGSQKNLHACLDVKRCCCGSD